MPLPPGPTAPPLAQTLRWAFRPVAMMEDYRRRFGNRFTVRLAAVGTFAFLADPADVKRVFTADPARFPAGESNRPLAPVLGERSVLLLDGLEHVRARRLLLPPFHGDRLARWRDLIAEVADEAIDRWPVGEEVVLQDRMQAITLDIILRVVFGLEDAERLADVRERVIRLLDVTATPIVLMPWFRRDLGPGSPFRRFLQARASLDEALFEELARRRRDPALGEREDILSVLLEARDEDGRPMSDGELRDQLLTLLFAGHETTATGLAWALERLIRHPEALARLREEALEGEGDRYADAVTQETLRLRPPIPIVARRLLEPLELDGLTLPEGIRAAPCIWLVHRDPDLYPDPYAFRPERFLERPPETYGWIPFGGGMRRCIGAAFATLEMRTVLQRVATRVDLATPPPGPERVLRRAIVLGPSRGGAVRPVAVRPAGARPERARPATRTST